MNDLKFAFRQLAKKSNPPDQEFRRLNLAENQSPSGL
jgi:hypothetical protein